MIDCTGQSDVWYFYHLDGLGSVVALSNTSGTIVASYSYDVFGAATVTGNEYGNPYRFTARRYDDETGLYYYRARIYAPNTGRFLQPDPVGYDDRRINGPDTFSAPPSPFGLINSSPRRQISSGKFHKKTPERGDNSNRPLPRKQEPVQQNRRSRTKN
jgi:RHS repeat-associated protein